MLANQSYVVSCISIEDLLFSVIFEFSIKFYIKRTVGEINAHVYFYPQRFEKCLF